MRDRAEGIGLRECPACGRLADHRRRFTVNGCDIIQCRDCGLGRTNRVGDFDPARYYTADYFAGRRADGYSDYLGAEPVLRREFARSVQFVRRFRAGGKLLELGCAYGFFLTEAASFFDVAGIELAREPAEHAQRSGLHVLHGSANPEDLRRIGRFDLLVLFDVIEHLPQPHETLALCLDYLNPNGIVVITTGDFASLAAKITGARWRLMTPPQHLWFFTRESICRMSRRLGLSVEYFDRPWKVVPLSLIFFQLQRITGFHGAALNWASRVGAPVNLFDAMRFVLRKRP